MTTGAPCAVKYVTINPGSTTLQLGGGVSPYGAWTDLRPFSVRFTGANLSAAIATLNSRPGAPQLSTAIANYVLIEVGIVHELVWYAPDKVDSASSFRDFSVKRYYN
jgi:hypothetical protein